VRTVLELKRINKYVGFIPIIGIALALTIELALGMRGQYVFNPPYLLLMISLTLISTVGFIVAYLSVKSYLATGSLALLLISMVFVVQSIAPIGTGLASTFSPSATVAIAALGLLVGSVIQLLAAIQTSFRSAPIGSEHRKARLTIAGFIAVLLSLIVVFLPFLPGFPSLFVDAAGVTIINQVIYAIAIGVFLIASFLFMRLYSRSKSSTFGVAWQLRFSDIVSWTGRLGWYAASLYYLIALRNAAKETNSQ
jgi:hypothetical protein